VATAAMARRWEAGRATARPGGAGARVAGEQQQKKEDAARHSGDARRALCAQTAPWTT